MEQWRSQVILEQRRKRGCLGKVAGGALYLGMLGGICYWGVNLLESTPIPPGEEETIGAVVIHDWFYKDLEGKYSLFNPLIDEGFRQLGLQEPESFPPYMDSYIVTVLEDCTPSVIEFPDVSFFGEDSKYENLAEVIEPGERVRITAVEGNGRYFGTSIELLGKAEIPALCPFFPSQDSRIGSVKDLESSGDWYLIQDAYLVDAMTAHEPALEDQVGLAQNLYERLLVADSTHCPTAQPLDIFLLDHAELIRLHLLMEHLEVAANRSAIGAMLDDDNADVFGEHGGRVLRNASGIAFEPIPNPVLEYDYPEEGIPPDAIYYFNHLDYRGMDVLAMFHFHAMYPDYNGGCPSEQDVGGAVSSNTDGIMISRQPDSTFNVTFYTNSGTVINLGPFDYGEQRKE